MQLLKVKIFVLLAFLADNITTELSRYEENVCLKEETYEDNVAVKVKKLHPVTIKKWCWNLLKKFSCERTVFTTIEETEIRPITRTRIVPKCCAGYEEREETGTEIRKYFVRIKEKKTTCFPVCLKRCVNGKCVAPETCSCLPGFYGSQCEKECSEGYWGKNCVNTCNCSDKGKCDKSSGCNCEEGWTGLRCEFPCKDGYYGHMCKMKCDCGYYTCDQVTGECLTTTAVTTQAFPETSTTTESVTTETSLEAHQISETTEMSTENEKLKEVNFSEDVSVFTEISTVTTPNPTDFSEIAEPSTNTEETTDSDLTSDIIYTTSVFINEMRPTETSRETPIKVIHVGKSEMGISNGLEPPINDSVDDNNNKTLSVPKSNSINETTQENKNRSEQDIDNFINDKKGSSNKKTMLKIFHFLPGLSVFSSVSFLTFIIASIWFINKYRKKNRKTLKINEKKEKILQLEDQIKYPTENFFWSNSCTNNPVYLSDVDLNRTTPVLETFKPLPSAKNTISSDNEIR